MNFSLIVVCKDNGETVDGTWLQDCVGLTLEQAAQRARETEAINTGLGKDEGFKLAVVESLPTGSPDYSPKKGLKRLDILLLKFVAMDSHKRPVYEDIEERLWKDVDPRKNRKLTLCTCYDNAIDGEADTPMYAFEKYKNLEVKFIPKRVTWWKDAKVGNMDKEGEEKMSNKKVASTEYAVEVNSEETYSFIRQIAVFPTYEEADEYTKTHTDCSKGEYYNIIFIDYDENGDEVRFGTVY